MKTRDKRRNGRAVVLVGMFAGALALTKTANVHAQVDEHRHARGATASRSDMNMAKQHYTDAIEKFRAGDYADALSHFQLANDVKATPQAERYIGRCLDALGRVKEASQWYERFLAHVPDKMAVQGERTRARLSEIRAEGKSPTVPGRGQRQVGSAARPRPATPTEPGRIETEKALASRAEPADSEVDAPATTPPEQPAVDAAQTVTPVPPPPSPESHHGPTLAYAAGGVAVLAAGVGVSFGILALNDKSSFESNPTSQNASNRNEHALIADVAFGVLLASGVTSAVLFLTHHEAAPAPDSAALPSGRRVARAKSSPAWTITPSPLVGARGAGAALTVRF